jgi:hypothetical protein
MELTKVAVCFHEQNVFFFLKTSHHVLSFFSDAFVLDSIAAKKLQDPSKYYPPQSPPADDDDERTDEDVPSTTTNTAATTATTTTSKPSGHDEQVPNAFKVTVTLQFEGTAPSKVIALPAGITKAGRGDLFGIDDKRCSRNQGLRSRMCVCVSLSMLSLPLSFSLHSFQQSISSSMLTSDKCFSINKA